MEEVNGTLQYLGPDRERSVQVPGLLEQRESGSSSLSFSLGEESGRGAVCSCSAVASLRFLGGCNWFYKLCAACLAV